ncbi:MAG: phosphoglycerate mutase family protein, partial [Christensenellaceae bacterium]|nr:phosphoglycerate mutase family protein [Christensenellaceae bacterium]
MKLYLIRHGRTMANEKWLYCGSTDIPLSDNGVKRINKSVSNYPEAQDYY